MDVIGKAVDGGTQRYHRLKRLWRMGRDLQPVKAAPADAHHAYRSAAPRLRGKPVDHLYAIGLFLRGVFILHHAIAVAIAAHIDPHAGISTFGKPRVGQRIPCGGAVTFAVGEVFQNHGHRRGIGIFRPPDSCGEPAPIREGNAHVGVFNQW